MSVLNLNNSQGTGPRNLHSGRNTEVTTEMIVIGTESNVCTANENNCSDNTENDNVADPEKVMKCTAGEGDSGSSFRTLLQCSKAGRQDAKDLLLTSVDVLCLSRVET